MNHVTRRGTALPELKLVTKHLSIFSSCLQVRSSFLISPLPSYLRNVA